MSDAHIPDQLGLIPAGGFLAAIGPLVVQSTGGPPPAADDDDDDRDLTVLELFRTIYRSLLPDGSIWCESSDPSDMNRRGPADGRPLTYQRLRIVLATTGWEPYQPSTDHPFNLLTVQEHDDEDGPEVQDTADEHDYDDEVRSQFMPSDD